MSRLMSRSSWPPWMHAIRRLGCTTLACVALSTAVATLTASPAAAHTGLVDSSPADGSQLSAQPKDLSFTFDQALQPVPGWDAVVVTGPDGSLWPVHTVQITGNTLTATCGHLGPAGTYAISYRVISGDGHPVAGHVTVTVGRSESGSPTMSAFGLPDGGVPAWACLIELALAAFFVVQACSRYRAARSVAVPTHQVGRRPGSAPSID